MDRLPPYDAVVLAGGAARRLDGADKPGVLVGGATLLDRVLGAVARAGRVVVVGPQRPTARPVEWAREDPPGAGPAAALAAGLPAVTAEWVAVLAADLPFLDTATVDVLRAEATTSSGALLVDPDAREQWLTGVWRTADLRVEVDRQGGSGLAGAPLRHLLGPLRAARCTVAPVDGRAPWTDCDTAADLERARAHA